MTTALHSFVDQSAAASPDRVAVVDPRHGNVTYRQLAELSDRWRDQFVSCGVRPGDRVGLCLPKSISTVSAILGALKSGAAYVPVDPSAPPTRNVAIFSDCETRVILTQDSSAEPLSAAWPEQTPQPHQILVDAASVFAEPAQVLPAGTPAPASDTAAVGDSDLAYILYTSGSTGVPKGVMLTHQNAVSFVEWCSSVFEPTAADRFSSHAPFHFDLSILDLYLPLRHGATLVLVDEEIGKSPGQLASLIAEHQITVWYSTPSILSMLAQYGKLQRYDYQALKTVLFAGEVFPIKHLQRLKHLLPHPRYFNLYGPTETNVCTFYEVPADIPAGRTDPFPIGQTCAHLESRVVDLDGEPVTSGAEGELCIRGAGVMQGYWNRPQQTEQAFLESEDGQRWYRTGDLVTTDENGDYLFVGRRDRMVKKRGYRVELGEVEAGLYHHPAVEEAAAIALEDEDHGVRIKVFLVCRGPKLPSLIELKAFCAEVLPSYMIPDLFAFPDTLPKTSTDKIDYQGLRCLE